MCLVIEDCERVINVIHLFPLKSYWPALLFFLFTVMTARCHSSSLDLSQSCHPAEAVTANGLLINCLCYFSDEI